MKSDLSFLPEHVRADPDFQRAWHQAVNGVGRAITQDLDRSSAKEVKAIQADAQRTIDAARWLKERIDEGEFARDIPVDAFAEDLGLSSEDIEKFRRLLFFLVQCTAVVIPQTIEQIPKYYYKKTNRAAGWWTGRLCAQFGLGRPTDYASDAHGGESVAISLMRCLVIESGPESEPSVRTLRRAMDYAKEGYAAFLEAKTLASN